MATVYFDLFFAWQIEELLIGGTEDEGRCAWVYLKLIPIIQISTLVRVKLLICAGSLDDHFRGEIKNFGDGFRGWISGRRC